MADQYARMRQLVGSSAEWLSNDIILGDGELGVEIIDANYARIRVGDGVQQFSNCPVVRESSLVLHDSADYDNHVSNIEAISGVGLQGLRIYSKSDQLDGGWISVTENKVEIGVSSATSLLELQAGTIKILDEGAFKNNVLWTPREINKSANFTFSGSDINNKTIILTDSITGTLDTTIGPDAGQITIFTQDSTGFQLVSNSGTQVIEWQQGGSNTQRVAPATFSIASYSVVNLHKSSDTFWFMWGFGIS